MTVNKTPYYNQHEYPDYFNRREEPIFENSGAGGAGRAAKKNHPSELKAKKAQKTGKSASAVTHELGKSSFNIDSLFKTLLGIGSLVQMFSFYNGGLFKAANTGIAQAGVSSIYPVISTGAQPLISTGAQPFTGTPDNLPGIGTPTSILNIPFGGNPVFTPNRGLFTDARQFFFTPQMYGATPPFAG